MFTLYFSLLTISHITYYIKHYIATMSIPVRVCESRVARASMN